VNVEHLLDIFTSIDTTSDSTWDACANFTRHLLWYKRRPTVLGPKIEGLPDDHRSKPECLFELSRLLGSVGNHVERKRLLTHTLELQRVRGDDRQVARTLSCLADAHRRLGLYEEWVQLAKEALEICERLSDPVVQAGCLKDFAWLLYESKQLDAAEAAASRALNLLPEKGEQFLVCKCHRILGDIYRFKGRSEKAIDHLEAALAIASSFTWHDQLFWIHYILATLCFNKRRFDEAHAHVGRAKSDAVNHPYLLGRAMEQQARFWYR